MLRGVLESLKFAKNIQVKTVLHPHFYHALPSDLQIPLPGEISGTVQWAGLAQSFDILWPIAPETDRILLDLVAQTRPLFGHVLAPGTDFIEMATDKKKTFKHFKLVFK